MEYFNHIYYPLKYVLIDNGFEFMKDFEKALMSERVSHWHIYPKSPKINTYYI